MSRVAESILSSQAMIIGFLIALEWNDLHYKGCPAGQGIHRPYAFPLFFFLVCLTLDLIVYAFVRWCRNKRRPKKESLSRSGINQMEMTQIQRYLSDDPVEDQKSD